MQIPKIGGLIQRDTGGHPRALSVFHETDLKKLTAAGYNGRFRIIAESVADYVRCARRRRGPRVSSISYLPGGGGNGIADGGSTAAGGGSAVATGGVAHPLLRAERAAIRTCSRACNNSLR